jgi:paraquat-inducible protein B
MCGPILPLSIVRPGFSQQGCRSQLQSLEYLLSGDITFQVADTTRHDQACARAANRDGLLSSSFDDD